MYEAESEPRSHRLFDKCREESDWPTELRCRRNPKGASCAKRRYHNRVITRDGRTGGSDPRCWPGSTWAA
jgi:hypothetical protein